MGKTESYTEFEPICECSKCGNVHLRKERKKVKGDIEATFLFIYVCPKCSAYAYTLIGDKEIKKRRKKCKQ